MTELNKIKNFYSKIIAGLALFILLESGTLIWILSSLNTKVGNNKENINEIKISVDKLSESNNNYFKTQNDINENIVRILVGD